MSYDTKLSSDEEKQFQDWKKKHAPKDSGEDYDLRGAFRYVACTLLLLGGLVLAVYGAYVGGVDYAFSGLELAAAPFGFIFGERLVLTYKGGAK